MEKIGQLPGSWRAKHDRISPELAMKLYANVQELASRDPSPVRIARRLSATYALSLSPGTIRHWMVGDRKPGLTGLIRNAFTDEPSPALSYIIGAIKGDGCTLVKPGIVKLAVADLDFAQTFNSSMARLFSRANPNKILIWRSNEDRLPLYVVRYACRQLVNLLRLPLTKLLEIAFAFPREFLRGFFDAEGHVDVSITEYFGLGVGAENSNKQLLSKVRMLLGELKVNSRFERRRRKGTIMMIRGKTFVLRRTMYSIDIGKLVDVKRFADGIGFSIKRKNQKLQEALSVIATYESRVRPAVWRQLYSKTGGEWVRKNLSR